MARTFSPSFLVFYYFDSFEENWSGVFRISHPTVMTGVLDLRCWGRKIKEIKCHSYHIMAKVHIVIVADHVVVWLTWAGSCLHCAGPSLLPCGLSSWKEITMHSPHLRSRGGLRLPHGGRGVSVCVTHLECSCTGDLSLHRFFCFFFFFNK